MTNKNDLEIAKIYSSTEKFHKVCDIFKHLLSLTTVIIALRLMFDGFKPFLSANPEAIEAIAHVIEKLNFSNITGYIIAGTTTLGWHIERKGKKRAIKEKGKFQKIAESRDEYRLSSKLTNVGDTPGGEK